MTSNEKEKNLWILTPFLLSGICGMILGIVAFVIYHNYLAFIPVMGGGIATSYNIHLVDEIINKGRKFP